MKRVTMLASLAMALIATAPASSRERAAPVISTDSIRAEEMLLAGPGLRGRGSATPDEAIAAGYVASFFRDAGLRHAPGMDSYFQVAPIERRAISGAATLTVAGVAVPDVTLLRVGGGQVGGKAVLAADPGTVPQADVLVYTGPGDQFDRFAAAARGKAKLVLLADDDATRQARARTGNRPRLRTVLAGATGWANMSVVAVPAAVLTRIREGDAINLDVPFTVSAGTTTNAIGYLPGTDPKAGVILISAHLDHLGVRPDGVVMPGANDDASGTVAVIELARAFAKMGPAKRGVLFVAYGSEELGGLGSTWFGMHPPLPLDTIVANIELEMIGEQDPKLPKGAMMMTGAERSDLFDLLHANGAQIAPDPYPDEHFFERSDNYSLALKGIVAHTLSGRVGATYHQPTDTVESLDLDYMTGAINSLVGPLRLLAEGKFTPQWKAGGRPQRP